jgi:hypothetical protein
MCEMSRKMGMMKRVASILLVLALLVGLLPTSVYATESGTTNASTLDGVACETSDGYGDEGANTILNESTTVTSGNETGDGTYQIESEETEPGENSGGAQ